MEPFGLFDLLKTLLPDQPKNSEPAPQDPPPQPKNTPPQNAETPPFPEQTNACWEFMTKHDERARNVKKRTP